MYIIYIYIYIWLCRKRSLSFFLSVSTISHHRSTICESIPQANLIVGEAVFTTTSSNLLILPWANVLATGHDVCGLIVFYKQRLCFVLVRGVAGAGLPWAVQKLIFHLAAEVHQFACHIKENATKLKRPRRNRKVCQF